MMELNELLERVVRKQSEHEEALIRLKALKQELDSIESLAAEALAASGMEKVTCFGRTWRTEVATYLSIPKDNRRLVIEAAGKEGIADELTTVNTSTLKAWLSERHGEGDADSLAEGTAFEGLVSEYRAVRLRSRSIG